MSRMVKGALRMLAMGAILMLAGFVLAGFNAKNLDSRGSYEEKSFETEAEIRSISIDEKNNGVTLRPSTDGVVRVTWYERKYERCEVDVDASGTLRVREVSDRPWYDYIGVSLMTNVTPITIYLPAQYIVPVDIKSTNGEVHIEDINMQSLTLKNTNGSVMLANVQAERVAVGGTNGVIALRDVRAGDTVEITTTNGKIGLSRVVAERIDARSTNGSVVLDAVDAVGAHYQTTNGSIRGTVTGAQADYTIESRTVLGSAKPSSGGAGARTLSAETVNGSINIGFAG